MLETLSKIINTYSISGAIILLYLYFLYQELQLFFLYRKIKNINQKDNLVTELSNSKLKGIIQNYIHSINFSVGNEKKTNIPASNYFSINHASKAVHVNLRSLDAASGLLVGLGLFGTFWGLTLGINNFDSSNTEHIQNSIQLLLNGMGTAFITSLAGMLASLLFIPFDKWFRNLLSKHLYILSENLDKQYYIDDIDLHQLNQENMLKNFSDNIKDLVTKQTHEILEKLTYSDQQGEIISVGNAIREILTENSEQSKALKSFSTDLALELNNGFDEILSREMQKKIVPLMENIDTTTKAVVEHIDSMASLVSSPAADMIQNMVDQMRASMSEIIAEFNKNLSGSATSELESLALQLGTASQAMADFPNAMGNISSTLQVTIEEVKQAVSEISNTSANANSAAMQQMQEQITFATGAISSAISEVKDVMSSISHSSQEQSNQMVSKLSDAADKMSDFLNSTVVNLSSSVQTSVKKITDNMNNKQADLITLQEDTTTVTRNLLEKFNVGLDRLEKMNEYITGTMNMFQQAQGQITGSTAHLQNITSDMKQATQLFNKSQVDYNMKVAELQNSSQQKMEALSDLMSNAGEMSSDYVQKFNIIKEGIGSIFEQIQKGLNEYSRTVQATTQKYLDQYSTSLTSTTDALSSTIQQQNEVVEMMVEAINNKKRS